MKKNLLTVTLLILGLTAMAQNVFTADELVWYGLDFSKAKMVGQFDQVGGAGPANGSTLKSKYIPGWNMLIVNEGKKYDLKKTFRKDHIYNDLAPVQASNAKLDPDNLLSINEYRFDDPNGTISKIVQSYSGGDKKEGVGVVFIVESFNKNEESATVYVTFFNISNKQVLFSERMHGKPQGIGLRNYWAGAIMNILRQIDDGAYKQWKSEHK